MKAMLSVVLAPLLLLSFFSLQTPAVKSSEIHDVAVTNVTAWPTVAVPAAIVYIDVTVENHGTSSESFNLTVYAENITIQTVRIANLAPGLNETLTLEWNIFLFRIMIFPPPWPTDEHMVENVTIWAEADIVAGEVDTSDNVYIDGTVTIIWRVQDVDGDGDFDIFDVVLLVMAYSSELGDPKYNAFLDFNQDGKIDIFDIVISASSYGAVYG